MITITFMKRVTYAERENGTMEENSGSSIVSLMTDTL